MSTDQQSTPEQPGWSPAPYDVLAAQPEETPRRAASWPLVGGAAVLVLALVGGVTYAVNALSGGGEQPADALPSGAVAVVSVDLDPSAGQKIDAFRYLRKFPTLRDRVPLDGDLREVLFDAVADEVGWQDIDFDDDVSPWLGKRVAFAAYPSGEKRQEPTVVVALQVTDQGAADDGLRQLTAAASDAGSVSWAFSGDYALVTEKQQVADDLAARAADAPLAADEHFAADVAAVQEGVALAWFDMGRAAEAIGDVGLMPTLGMTGAGGASGRSTLVARFDGPDVFEVVGRATGVEEAGWADHEVRGMADLPASSAVAFGMADGELLAPRLWEGFQGFFGTGGESDLQDELGLSMPGDLSTLLGDNLLLALDSSTSDTLHVGARITTDVAAAQRLLDRLEGTGNDQMLPELSTVRREVGGDLVVATTGAQADRMAADGTLGDDPAFRAALPDLGEADVALFVDPAGLWSVFPGGSEVDPDVEPLDGVGLTVGGDGADEASFRFRLVAH